MEQETIERADGISRRTVIKRGAIVGGAIWAAPAITTLSRAGAQGAGTPACECEVLVVVSSPGGGSTNRRCRLTEEACKCACFCDFEIGEPCECPAPFALEPGSCEPCGGTGQPTCPAAVTGASTANYPVGDLSALLEVANEGDEVFIHSALLEAPIGPFTL